MSTASTSHGQRMLERALAMSSPPPAKTQITNKHAERENAQHDIEQTPLDMGSIHGCFGGDFVEQIRLENCLFKWLLFSDCRLPWPLLTLRYANLNRFAAIP